MISVELHLVFKVMGNTDDLDQQTDALMDALLRLERPNELADSSVSADLGSAMVEVDIVGTGETFEAAVLVADSAIRTAIHEVGGSTPDWNTTYQTAELVAV